MLLYFYPHSAALKAEFYLNVCDDPQSYDNSFTQTKSGFPLFSTQHTLGFTDILCPDPLDLQDLSLGFTDDSVTWDSVSDPLQPSAPTISQHRTAAKSPCRTMYSCTHVLSFTDNNCCGFETAMTTPFCLCHRQLLPPVSPLQCPFPVMCAISVFSDKLRPCGEERALNTQSKQTIGSGLGIPLIFSIPLVSIPRERHVPIFVLARKGRQF